MIDATFPAERSPTQSGFLHTVLFESAWQLAKSYRSKNPTWVKKPEVADRIEQPAREVVKLVLSAARKKVADCEAKKVAAPTIKLGSSTQLNIPAASVDFVLTSPPYCTRIDYAVSTRIELAILGYGDAEVGTLRDAMMGTSTIRQHRRNSQEQWGDTCNTLLSGVLAHPSKASANYYYKTFIQYFSDLQTSLGEIHRCAKPGVGIVVVVQDSHYKGIRVDLPRIVEEMGMSLKWSLKSREDYAVSQTMLLVNTRSRSYRNDASAVESVLWFNSAKEK